MIMIIIYFHMHFWTFLHRDDDVDGDDDDDDDDDDDKTPGWCRSRILCRKSSSGRGQTAIQTPLHCDKHKIKMFVCVCGGGALP